MQLSFMKTSLALAFQTCFFGVYCMLFSASVWILLKKQRSKTDMHLLVISTLLFLVCASHTILNFSDVMLSLRHGNPQHSDHSSLYYGKKQLFNIIMVIQDSYITYRCFIVWDRSWRYCAVSFAFLSIMISAIVWSIAQPTEGTSISMAQGFLSHGACALVNIICTAMIVYRIAGLQKRFPTKFGPESEQGSRLFRSVLVLVESSALYTMSMLAVFVTWLISPSSSHILECVLVPVVGVIFTLLVLRLGLDNIKFSWSQERLTDTPLPRQSDFYRTGTTSTMQALIPRQTLHSPSPSVPSVLDISVASMKMSDSASLGGSTIGWREYRPMSTTDDCRV